MSALVYTSSSFKQPFRRRFPCNFRQILGTDFVVGKRPLVKVGCNLVPSQSEEWFYLLNDHSNETSSAVLSHGTIFSMYPGVYGSNPMVCILCDHSTETSSTVHILRRRIVYFSAFYQIKFAFFFRMLTLVTSESELSRVNALQKL